MKKEIFNIIWVAVLLFNCEPDPLLGVSMPNFEDTGANIDVDGGVDNFIADSGDSFDSNGIFEDRDGSSSDRESGTTDASTSENCNNDIRCRNSCQSEFRVCTNKCRTEETYHCNEECKIGRRACKRNCCEFRKDEEDTDEDSER